MPALSAVPQPRRSITGREARTARDVERVAPRSRIEVSRVGLCSYRWRLKQTAARMSDIGPTEIPSGHCWRQSWRASEYRCSTWNLLVQLDSAWIANTTGKRAIIDRFRHIDRLEFCVDRELNRPTSSCPHAGVFTTSALRPLLSAPIPSTCCREPAPFDRIPESSNV